MFRGPKPDFIPKGRIVSKKEIRHYEYVRAYENPVEKALEYARIMKEEKLSQSELAKKLGISRVRVNQVLGVLKLPQEKQKYILEKGKIDLITERSLRDLLHQ